MGVMKNASSSNGCRILKYEGMDDNKTPIFSMYKINGEIRPRLILITVSTLNAGKCRLVSVTSLINQEI